MSIVFRLAALFCITASASVACTNPPAESISLTWPPASVVYVTYDSRLDTFGAATTAINGWNNSNIPFCFAPYLSLGPGSGPAMFISYGPIPNDPNGSVRRGLTTIFSSGRITSAVSTINSGISTNFPAVITDVIAHEIGHTMGLNDCNYPSCPLYSSVMENNANVPQWTATQGQPSPTTCDLAVMIGVAPDYVCVAPPGGGDDPCPPADGEVQPVCSPIVLDVSGQGFELTDAASGVSFDISGTGQAVQMGWTAAGANNAFLALPGPDGLVHNGKELFGNFTAQPPSSNRNGFAALAVYDDPKNGGNGDGVIDSRDAIFASLRLWIDANHDGICQPDELHTLLSLGVNSISLDYHLSKKTDQYGNVFRYRSKVNPDDPDASDVGRKAYDVFFVTQPSPVSMNLARPRVKTASVQVCPVPARSRAAILSQPVASSDRLD